MEASNLLDQGFSDSANREDDSGESYSFMKSIFSYCYNLQRSAKFTSSMAAFLFIVSGYQLLGLLLDSNVYMKGSAVTRDYVAVVIQSTRVVPYIFSQNSKEMYFGSIALAFLFLVAFIYLAISAHFSKRYWAVMCELEYYMYWLLFIPFMEIWFSTFRCNSESTHPIVKDIKCYGNDRIFLGIVISMLVLANVGAVALATIVCSPTNGLNGDPFARYQWENEVIYFLVRLYLCIHINWIAPNYTLVFLVVIVAYGIYLLYTYLKGFTYYSPEMSAIFSSWTFVYCATVIVVILILIMESLGKEVEGICVILLLLHAASYLLAIFLNDRKIKNLANSLTFSTIQELDRYIHYSYKAFVDKSYVTDFPTDFFEGILLIHKRSCNDPYCPLLKRDAEQAVFELKKGKIQTYIKRYKVMDENQKKYADKQLEENKTQQKLSDLKSKMIFLLHVSEKHNQLYNTTYLLQLATLMLELSQNVHKAYLCIAEAETNDPQLLLYYTFHCKKMEIANAIQSQLSTLSDHGVPQYKEVIKFETLLNKLKGLVRKNSVIRENFWNCLNMQVVDMNTIHGIGQQIMEQVTTILRTWEDMKAIYPYQRDALMLYSEYLYYILAEKREALTLQSTLDMTAQAHMKRWSSGKHSIFTESAAVVVVSGNSDTFGKIVRSSRRIEGLFGYRPEEMIGKSIAILMPDCLAERHSEFLKNTLKDGSKRNEIKKLKKSTTALQHVSIYSFAVSRDGYVFPVYISHQQLYSDKFGICYIGLIRKDPTAAEAEFIISDTDGKIRGISSNFGARIRMGSNVLIEQQAKMQTICTQMASEEGIAHYKGFMMLDLKFSDNIKSAIGSNETPKNIRRDSLKSNLLGTLKLECDANKISYSGYELMVFKLNDPEEDENDPNKGGSMRNLMTFGKIIPEMAYQYPIQKLPTKKAEKGNQAKNGVTGSLVDSNNMSSVNLTSQQQLMARFETAKMANTNSSNNNLKQAIVNNEFDIQSYSSVSSKPAQARTVRTIRQLRRQTMDNFYSVPVNRLKSIAFFFFALISLLIISNIVTNIYFLTQMQDMIYVNIYNSKRQISFSFAARSIQQLIVIDNGTIALQGKRSQYNYGEIGLPVYKTKTRVYRDYVISNLKMSIQYALDGEYSISIKAEHLDSEYSSVVIPDFITTRYPTSSLAPTSVESSRLVVVSFISHALRICNSESSTAVPFSTAYLLNNSFQAYIGPFTATPDAVKQQCVSFLDIQSFVTISFMIVVVCLGIIFVAIGIPVISQATKEMDETLRYLLYITSQDIKLQLRRISHFLKSGSHMQDSKSKSNNDGFEMKDDEAITLNEDKDKDKSEETKQMITQKFNSYLSYNGSRKSLVITIITSIIILMTFYLGLYEISNYVKTFYLFQMAEAESISVIANGNALLLATVYRYIVSFGNSTCEETDCRLYIKKLAMNQTARITNLMFEHKLHSQYFSEDYDNEFKFILENNLCLYKGLVSQTGCADIFGGILRKGTAVTNHFYLGMLISIYEDFLKSSQTLADVQYYLNDDRFVDIEILHDNFLHPIYIQMLENLLKSSEAHINIHLSYIVVFAVMFVLYMFIIGFGGLRILVNNLTKTAFDTKSMLAALPTDVIMNNYEILMFLAGSTRSEELPIIKPS